MMILRLIDYDAPSFSSPDAGERLGRDLVAALTKGQVVLDFAGLRSVLSVGLNPAIGQVYEAFDRETIRQRLQPQHMSPAHEFVWAHVLETAKRHREDMGGLQRSTADILGE